MPHELAFELLAVFSRFEYALKSTKYAHGGNNRVYAWWDKFANDIDSRFYPSADHELEEAVTYLLTSPPRKQVLKVKKVVFSDAPPDPKQKQTKQVLNMVRRVRNNLFHGGKYLPLGEVKKGRNELLVKYALRVLKACVVLQNDVRKSFET